MASAGTTITEGGNEMASLPVVDELLAEIFLRLPTAADLVRASANCVSFRRLITAQYFVRCFRKRHVPTLLGVIDDYKTFHPATPPHPSAAEAGATALAADFSFSFLPTPARAGAWIVKDSRDGRILLDTNQDAVFTEMVVCDPLHRRYLLLPPIPDDLAASVEDLFSLEPQFWREAFLAPPADDEEPAKETSFRVIWMAQCKMKIFAFVFSSTTGQWRAISPPRWNDLFPRLTPAIGTLFRFRQYSYGCFYWKCLYYRSDSDSETVVLDTRTMEFSVAQPPHEGKSYIGFAMVEAGESKPGKFVLAGGTLNYSIRQNSGGNSSLWRKEKSISLGPGHFLIGSTQSCLLMYKQVRSSLHQSGLYTLDVETFQLEKMCHPLVNGFLKLHTYSNFRPSFMSLPTISSGFEEEVGDMMVQGHASSSSAKSPCPEK